MLKQFKTYHYGPLVLIVLLAMACSNARYLSEKESLYLGADVKITDTFATAAERKNFQVELEEAVRPKPNSTFIGIRLKLTLYNIAGVPKKETGLRNLLRNKIGEPPVLGSDVNIGSNNKVLQNILQNYGFFTAESTGFLDVKKKKSKAKFEITTGPRTYVRNVRYEPGDSSDLGRNILNTQDKTLLKSGDPYSLQAIIDERMRVDYALKNQGYYYFSPDYLVVVADTGIGNNLTDLTLKVKYNEIPRNAYKQYRINKVSVYPNYRLNNKSRAGSNQSKDSAVSFSGRRREASSADTVKFDDFQVIDRNHTYRPYVFYQAMQFEPGEYYNKKDQNIALNRLVTLGAFKFVKNEFTPVKDSTKNLLDVDYLLTPYAKKSFNGELGGFTQNDSRGGVRGTIAWKNKNVFRGAELLTIKLSGSFEAQYGGVSQRPNEYTTSIQANLNVPRFIIPFVQVKPSGMYIPRTLINAGYEYSLRSGYYRIHSFNVAYGYNWKEDIRKDHKLFPINITLVQTDTIDKADLDDFNLNNLIYNGLIFGPTYEFTYNTQADGLKRKTNFYFNGMIDLSGNIVGLAQKASFEDNPEKIFNSNYAQYIKTQMDFRFYRAITPKSSVAARALLGFGYAYGNSSKLPNIKQFFSGGSSSLRGFPSRLVGPGTYDFRTDYPADGKPIIEALGDIKSEFSFEYRAKIYSVIEGGAFIDAGNIWLLRDDPNFPGGTFSKNFYKEMAADVGLGLRFDFSILLLRLDFAFPIRKPWYAEGNRWVIDEIRFGDPDWRKQNLLFNLAIGYPF